MTLNREQRKALRTYLEWQVGLRSMVELVWFADRFTRERRALVEHRAALAVWEDDGGPVR